MVLGNDDDPVGIGIEGTFAPFQNRDTLEITGHYERWRDDFALIKDLGIKEFRYPIPWHRIERVRGQRDWRELDEILSYIYDDLGLSIIADPIHHNIPQWFVGGYLDPALVRDYPDFIREFTARYPKVKKLAPINEPTATLDFCGCRAWWQPHLESEDHYVWMVRNASLAASRGANEFLSAVPDATIIHVDTCEHHKAIDADSQDRAWFLNERRFLFDDLLRGLVTRDHPLYPYLVSHGFPELDLEWLAANPVRIDIRGINYYMLNEEELKGGQTHHAPSHNPRGFASVAYDYYERLQLPLRMTETNIQGYHTDRISWLKHMREQYEQLRERLPRGFARGFDWYPLFDCKGWFVLLQEGEWPWDPQGIYWCDAAGNRHSSELSYWYAHLVRGGKAADLPAYRFQGGLAKSLKGLLPLMPWKWVEPNLK